MKGRHSPAECIGTRKTKITGSPAKLDAAVTQLANGAARGDKKAIQLAFALLQALEPAIEAQRPVYFLGGVLTQGDRTI
jgi:hypothetical protein